MKRRRKSGLSRYVLVWGTISVLVIGLLMGTMQLNQASQTKERQVSLASKSKLESPGIPPIDEAAPSKIETASFGLG